MHQLMKTGYQACTARSHWPAFLQTLTAAEYVMVSVPYAHASPQPGGLAFVTSGRAFSQAPASALHVMVSNLHEAMRLGQSYTACNHWPLRASLIAALQVIVSCTT